MIANETPRTDAAVRQALAAAGIADPEGGARRLARIAETPEGRAALGALLPHLLTTLATAAAPDRVLVNLARFVRGASDGIALLDALAQHPRAVEILVTLFAGSQFLTEILLRNPEYFDLVMAHRDLARPKSLAQFCAEAQACVATPEAPRRARLDALRRFQRWELLRIGTCDLLDLFDLPAVTGQLSHLADSLVRAGLALAAEGDDGPDDGLVVLAMGKLGGEELNYSSDIDLLFLAEDDAGGLQRRGERLIRALAEVTAEGFLYRVDMRLRPWGRAGALVTSVDGYLGYLREHARLWEKQALLKARVIAGSSEVGAAFLRRATPLLFETDGADLRADVHRMKRRTEAQLRQQGRRWGEVKLGEGSIRDVEFVTQYLQLRHGRYRPEIRSRNTLDALARLAAAGLLAMPAHRVLGDGYVLFRTIEHHLQMMHHRQTHSLPEDPAALAYLARRLGFEGEDAGAQFVARYEQHRAAVRDVYLHYLGEDTMETPEDPPLTVASTEHVARMAASYADIFSDAEIRLHTTMAQRLDAAHLVDVVAVPQADGRWRVTIVGYDYPGELSLICGLLFAYRFSILDGNVFTYEPQTAPSAPCPGDTRRKIVDVFTVVPLRAEVTPELWQRYADDLAELLALMQAGQRREARGRLARRVTAALPTSPEATPALYPIDIEIDNAASPDYTLLHIDTPDTIGFLYEFTNALAYHRIYIARVTVASVGERVHDTLYVTDADGHKITAPEQQRELRAAVVLIKHFTHLLPHCPNPEAALLHFRQFIWELFRRPDWPDELASLENPEVLHALARLLGVSDFLWDDFLRMQHANLFPVVRDVDALETSKTREELQAELEATLRPVHGGPQPPSEDAPWRAALNAFKDREMFRIDMRHILGHTEEFWDFSEELTALAEVVVNAAYHLCHEDLRTIHGTPRLESGAVSEMTVCALGKCGGRELGFASDVELMFIYAGNGMTTGPQPITTAEFYEKVVQTFLQTIQAKREGIFEIDLRLRPYGQAGSMAVSRAAFERYFAPDGPAWAYERQALVKLRPIAGNPGLGEHVTAQRDQFVYDGPPFDVTAMRAMRERQIRHLVTGGTFNAKYSPGGLVDVEYLVQGLQINHGHRHRALRRTNIRAAMAAMADVGVLTAEAYAHLRRAHTFLRWLIDGLRMVRGNAKDLTVPAFQSEAFAYLARRLRYGDDTAQLREDLHHHAAHVQALNQKLLG